MLYLPLTWYAIFISVYQAINLEVDMSDGWLRIKFVVPEYFQCVIYAILMTICSTFIIEMWKRKQNFIVSQLGINPSKDSSLALNPDFSGFAAFSWSNFQVSKRPIDKSSNKCYQVLNGLCYVMMLSVSCCCYFLLKKYITNPVFEGLAIFVVSTITNELQRQCCKFFVGQSNIKYLKTRNDVYMFTISSYRLINVNLPVFYAILWPGFADSKSEHYSKMYVLVLTIVISKVFAFLFF